MNALPAVTYPKPLAILLVEDNADTLKYLRRYVEKRGHETQTANTMHAALAAVAAGSFDVLISDIGLPDGDGWELLERAGLPDSVYTVAMSGFGMAGDQRRSRAVGYRQYLLKPFTPDQLDEFLAEAAREKAMRVAPFLE